MAQSDAQLSGDNWAAEHKKWVVERRVKAVKIRSALLALPRIYEPKKSLSLQRSEEMPENVASSNRFAVLSDAMELSTLIKAARTWALGKIHEITPLKAAAERAIN